jgi:hypothetical protein
MTLPCSLRAVPLKGFEVLGVSLPAGAERYPGYSVSKLKRPDFAALAGQTAQYDFSLITGSTL